MSVEYLATEREPSRHRPSPWLTVAVLVVVLLASLVVIGSELVRRQANASMAAALQVAQDQSRIGTGSVQSTLAYASPMIWSESVSEEVRAGLREVVQDSAADVVGRLAAVRQEVDAVTVLPWQRAQLLARDRLSAHIAAQQERFARISRDARSIGAALEAPAPSPAEAIESLRASGADGPLLR